MLTPIGLWHRIHRIGSQAVVDAIPELDRRGGEMLLAIARYRAGEGSDLLGVSRAVDGYCGYARTVGETAVLVGAMSEADLPLVLGAVQAISAEMESGRALARDDSWVPGDLFVKVDVDGMPEIVLRHIRNGVGQAGGEHGIENPRAEIE